MTRRCQHQKHPVLAMGDGAVVPTDELGSLRDQQNAPGHGIVDVLRDLRRCDPRQIRVESGEETRCDHGARHHLIRRGRPLERMQVVDLAVDRRVQESRLPLLLALIAIPVEAKLRPRPATPPPPCPIACRCPPFHSRSGRRRPPRAPVAPAARGGGARRGKRPPPDWAAGWGPAARGRATFPARRRRARDRPAAAARAGARAAGSDRSFRAAPEARPASSSARSRLQVPAGAPRHALECDPCGPEDGTAEQGRQRDHEAPPESDHPPRSPAKHKRLGWQLASVLLRRFAHRPSVRLTRTTCCGSAPSLSSAAAKRRSTI